jgi:hypothetical protein
MCQAKAGRYNIDPANQKCRDLRRTARGRSVIGGARLGRFYDPHQIIPELIGQFRDLHSFGNNNFAGKDRARRSPWLAGQSVGDPAKLAFLIPAEASVGDGFWAYVLEDAQAGILLGDLEFFSQNRDLDQPFKVTIKWVSHKEIG